MQISETSKHPILRLACPQAIIQLKLECHTDRMKHNFNIYGFPEKLKSYNKQLILSLHNHEYKSIKLLSIPKPHQIFIVDHSHS